MSYSRNQGIGWLQYHMTPSMFQSGGPMMIKSLSENIQGGFLGMQQSLYSLQESVQASLENGFSGMMLLLNQVGALLSAEQRAIWEQTVMGNQQLQQISQQLADIHRTLQTAYQTQVAEFRTMGLERLDRGLYEEALEAFDEAEKRDHTDMLTLYNKGKIYLYGDGKSARFIDLEKAGVYLAKAEKYISAEVHFLQAHPKDETALKQLKALYAELLLHLSQYYFICGNEIYAQNGCTLTPQARQNYQQMLHYAQLSNESFASGEAGFLAVKAHLMLGNAPEALKQARQLLTHFFNYLYKLQHDEDCQALAPQLNELMLTVHPQGASNLAMQAHVLMQLDPAKALEAARQAILEDSSVYEAFGKPVFQSIAPQLDNCMFWKTLRELQPEVPSLKPKAMLPPRE